MKKTLHKETQYVITYTRDRQSKIVKFDDLFLALSRVQEFLNDKGVKNVRFTKQVKTIEETDIEFTLMDTKTHKSKHIKKTSK